MLAYFVKSAGMVLAKKFLHLLDTAEVSEVGARPGTIRLQSGLVCERGASDDESLAVLVRQAFQQVLVYTTRSIVKSLKVRRLPQSTERMLR